MNFNALGAELVCSSRFLFADGDSFKRFFVQQARPEGAVSRYLADLKQEVKTGMDTANELWMLK